MNDPVVQQLQRALGTHGRALLGQPAQLEQLLTGVAATFPGKVKALLILLDKKAVAFLIDWAEQARPGKLGFEQLRQQMVAKFEQANVLNAAAASWAFDAWAAALGIAPGALAAQAAPRAVAVSAAAAPSAGGAPAPRNVYAPPGAPVEDPRQGLEDEHDFIEGGRAVPAGHGVSWLGEGWRLFKESPLIWIVNVILFLVITVAVQVVPIVGGIAGALLAPVLGAGLMIGAHALRHGETLEVGHLFAGFRQNTGALVLVGVVYLVGVIAIVVVAMLLMGASFVGLMAGGGEPVLGPGLILAILIGVALAIPLAMAYWFAPALVALNGLSAIEAMKMSFWGCLKNILPFLVYGLVALVAAIVATIPLALGWLVLGPVLAASMYASYRDIFYQE
ncbi:MAG TPA: BPSS1780 family membrane protein [Burkholderiales bacterium]|nr:BPSS1780 family membrane protein [Burkholderiales bacterium]